MIWIYVDCDYATYLILQCPINQNTSPCIFCSKEKNDVNYYENLENKYQYTTLLIF